MLELVPCPEPDCRAPAEIVSRFTLRSTHGPVEHLQTRCSEGHVRTPLAETVAVAEPVPLS
jgi:hypothetical protein